MEIIETPEIWVYSCKIVNLVCMYTATAHLVPILYKVWFLFLSSRVPNGVWLSLKPFCNCSLLADTYMLYKIGHQKLENRWDLKQKPKKTEVNSCIDINSLTWLWHTRLSKEATFFQYDALVVVNAIRLWKSPQHYFNQCYIRSTHCRTYPSIPEYRVSFTLTLTKININFLRILAISQIIQFVVYSKKCWTKMVKLRNVYFNLIHFLVVKSVNGLNGAGLKCIF